MAASEEDGRLDLIFTAHGFGGRHDHKAAPSDRRVIYELFLEGIIDGVARFREDDLCIRPIPPVFAGVYRYNKVHAYVTRQWNNYYIGMSRGSFAVLTEAFRRLLSMPTVFPWIGDVSKERPDRIVEPLSRDASLLTIDQQFRPINEDRAAAATLMIYNALSFLSQHEINHVVRGHVDYTDRHLGIHAILEVNSVGTSSESNLIKQTLEIEADASAAVNLLAGQLLRPHDSLPLAHTFLQPHDDALNKMFIISLTGIISALKIMSHDMPEYHTWDQLSHPPIDMRIQALLFAVQTHLKKMGHQELADDTEFVLGNISSVSAALHQILNDRPATDEWVQQFGPHKNVNNYLAKLSEIRLKINPELSQHAYVTTPIMS